MGTPNEITIKIATKKEIDLLYQQYLNDQEIDTQPNLYFSRVNRVYTRIDIEDYNNTINRCKNYNGITFEPIIYKKVNMYLPRAAIFSVRDTKERDPNSKECLEQLFQELESLKEFVSLHYIQIPEQIKETVLLDIEIQKNIKEFSKTPKITSTKTKKWGTLQFTDTIDTTETTTTTETIDNPFETITEIPIDTIIIEQRIENYLTNLDVKIPEPECRFDGTVIINNEHSLSTCIIS